MPDTVLDLLSAGHIPAMTFEQFVDKVIETGIKGSREHYGEDDEKFRGSKAGFEACRGKNPIELGKLLAKAKRDTALANVEGGDYWHLSFFACQVEWTCNCVSAVLLSSNTEVIVQPTVRGVMHAQSILTGQA